jgi:hypothetical protein
MANLKVCPGKVCPVMFSILWIKRLIGRNYDLPYCIFSVPFLMNSLFVEVKHLMNC